MSDDIESNKEYDVDCIMNGIRQDIRELWKNGRIIKMFPGDDRPRVCDVRVMCSQGTEGLLYDLDLDEAVLAAVHRDDPIVFADRMAVANTIRFLHEYCLEHSGKRRTVRYRIVEEKARDEEAPETNVEN